MSEERLDRRVLSASDDQGEGVGMSYIELNETDDVVISVNDLQLVREMCLWLSADLKRSPRSKKLKALVQKTSLLDARLMNPQRLTVLASEVDALRRQIHDISETLDNVHSTW